jgi:hypothetical protein
MDTNAPAPKPDMMEQMKKLLERYSMGMRWRGGLPAPTATPPSCWRSAILAVAGELRDIHNMLADVRDSSRAIGGSLAALVQAVEPDGEEDAERIMEMWPL